MKLIKNLRIILECKRFEEYSHSLKDRKIPNYPEENNRGYGHPTSYGEETWTLTKHQEKKLAVAQRSMERSLLNITKRDKIQNEVIRSKTGVKYIIERGQCMRGQWAGHVVGMSNTRWATITSEWTPRERKRVGGRPKRRCRDSSEEVGLSQWMSVVLDQRTWRELWRPPASSGMNG